MAERRHQPVHPAERPYFFPDLRAGSRIDARKHMRRRAAEIVARLLAKELNWRNDAKDRERKTGEILNATGLYRLSLTGSLPAENRVKLEQFLTEHCRQLYQAGLLTLVPDADWSTHRHESEISERTGINVPALLRYQEQFLTDRSLFNPEESQPGSRHDYSNRLLCMHVGGGDGHWIRKLMVDPSLCTWEHFNFSRDIPMTLDTIIVLLLQEPYRNDQNYQLLAKIVADSILAQACTKKSPHLITSLLLSRDPRHPKDSEWGLPLLPALLHHPELHNLYDKTHEGSFRASRIQVSDSGIEIPPAVQQLLQEYIRNPQEFVRKKFRHELVQSARLAVAAYLLDETFLFNTMFGSFEQFARPTAQNTQWVPDMVFDVGLAVRSTSHIRDHTLYVEFLQRMARCLMPGGLYVDDGFRASADYSIDRLYMCGAAERSHAFATDCRCQVVIDNAGKPLSIVLQRKPYHLQDSADSGLLPGCTVLAVGEVVADPVLMLHEYVRRAIQEQDPHLPILQVLNITESIVADFQSNRHFQRLLLGSDSRVYNVGATQRVSYRMNQRLKQKVKQKIDHALNCR